MRYEHAINIAAPPESVWAALADLERWPQWTPTVTAAAPLEAGALRAGLPVLVEQPGRPPAVWTATRVEDGRSFAWETRAAGMRILADHVIAPAGDGSRVTLSIEVSGPAAPLLGWVVMRAARRNVPLEAAGLKQRAEG